MNIAKLLFSKNDMNIAKRLLSVSLLTAMSARSGATSPALNCDDVKHSFKHAGCCEGNPNDTVTSLTLAHPAEAFVLYGPWPAGFTGIGTQVADFTDFVTELTEGQFTFQYQQYWADYLESAAVAQNQTYTTSALFMSDVGMWPLTAWPNVLPQAEAFFAWSTSREGKAHIDAVFRERGVWACHFQDTTRQDHYIMGPNTTLPTGDNLTGYRMRVGGFSKLFERMGAKKVNIGGSELYNAILNDRVDFVDWLGMWNLDVMGFHGLEGITLVGPGLHEERGSMVFAMERRRYDALPAHSKTVLNAACDAFALRSMSEFAYNNVQFNEKHRNIPRASFPQALVHRFYMEAQRYLEEKLQQTSSAVRAMVASMLSFDRKWKALSVHQKHASLYEQLPPLPPSPPPSAPSPPPVPRPPPTPPVQPPVPETPPVPPGAPPLPDPPPPPPKPPAPPQIPTWKEEEYDYYKAGRR